MGEERDFGILSIGNFLKPSRDFLLEFWVAFGYFHGGFPAAKRWPEHDNCDQMRWKKE
ncbi:hypothetical protein BVRB_012610 [Beta vulgaris subsp. vulgaris]|uniref:Uncharacterized protein n=1 Tax=Beta vulgaris subsp. vulgaris TaxID=3555 RepID=A0A0J8B5D1_BETVV|nr:hypothetical protein BVRB_012610 [Beta vulgaris subsp. vulgaris]